MYRWLVTLIGGLVVLAVPVVQKVRQAAAQKQIAVPSPDAGSTVSSKDICIQEDEAYRRKELINRRCDLFARRAMVGGSGWVAPEADYQRFAAQRANFFPDLSEAYDLVGPAGETQNCISYTVGEQFTSWTSPDFCPYDIDKWPPGTSTVTEFYQKRGYALQDDLKTGFKEGVQKIVVFVGSTDDGLMCKHAAVQQPNGNWRSKLGKEYVIEHVNPEELCDKRAPNYCKVGMVFWKTDPAFKKTYHSAP